MSVTVTFGANPAYAHPNYSGSSTTFTSMNGGTSFPSGCTVVVLIGGNGGGTAPPFTSAIMGGVSLTRDATASVLSTGGEGMDMWWADLPSGATDTLVVNYGSGQSLYNEAGAWYLTGAATGGPSNHAGNASKGATTTLTLALPTNGAIIVGAYVSQISAVPTWTNTSSSSGDFDQAAATAFMLTGASSTSASNPSVTGVGYAFDTIIGGLAWSVAAVAGTKDSFPSVMMMGV